MPYSSTQRQHQDLPCVTGKCHPGQRQEGRWHMAWEGGVAWFLPALGDDGRKPAVRQTVGREQLSFGKRVGLC